MPREEVLPLARFDGRQVGGRRAAPLVRLRGGGLREQRRLHSVLDVQTLNVEPTCDETKRTINNTYVAWRFRRAPNLFAVLARPAPSAPRQQRALRRRAPSRAPNLFASSDSIESQKIGTIKSEPSTEGGRGYAHLQYSPAASGRRFPSRSAGPNRQASASCSPSPSPRSPAPSYCRRWKIASAAAAAGRRPKVPAPDCCWGSRRRWKVSCSGGERLICFLVSCALSLRRFRLKQTTSEREEGGRRRRKAYPRARSRCRWTSRRSQTCTAFARRAEAAGRSVGG